MILECPVALNKRVKSKGGEQQTVLTFRASVQEFLSSSEDRDSNQRTTDRRIEEKHQHIKGRGAIRDVVLGLSDGVITNVAFLAGFSGATQNLEVIKFAGAAAMLAGAVSMFFGGLVAAAVRERSVPGRFIERIN